jgi:predicted RNA binding protein YcfA (HicA-like mRNA interferase family)
MGEWPATKAARVLAALLRIGWRVKRETGGSHKILERPGWLDVTWAYHDGVEIWPGALRRIAKRTGLRPEDL